MGLGRTVILVSHHVQLCAEGASYVVALDNGHVQFEGSREAFQTSGVIRTLVQSGFTDEKDAAPEKEEELVETQLEAEEGSETSSTIAPTVTPSEATTAAEKKKPARKLVEEEKRAVGRIGKDIWLTYIRACGSPIYWSIFILVFVLGALSPVAENSWLKFVLFFAAVVDYVSSYISRYWSNKVLEADGSRGPVFYVSVYAAVSLP